MMLHSLTHCSLHDCSAPMQLLCYFIISVLYIPPALSSVTCSDKQYPWPILTPGLCCEKCPPGYHLGSRTQNSCDRECQPCKGDRFTDSYNTAMSCSFCKSCDNPNMEVKTKCNTTHDTVCTCKAGYQCKNQDCQECVVIPTTTKPTVPPSTTVARPGVATTHLPPKQIGDTAWFLVIIALLCTGIVLVFMTKIKPFLLWIKSKHGYFLAEKSQPPCAGVEVVSKPIQEMCGKCETCI
ncbi:tumor necrosis factor receptor superfamily member 5 isoform X2 [Archocentrus centrarchus]|uniref:tumor necrosis factor receptor superfamily member 5 isoform X2 n=1 Tax=Archocentrus centrarchus TaxID=63155 RepID=UPI0011E9B738|nr:tumor necrosis factor receptor superfamily member 5-like isoform X2 [Archocentrus centrarchus]